ncbi:MAG: hypothetical protein V4857_20220 [Pseudomonadota bacterium]
MKRLTLSACAALALMAAVAAAAQEARPAAAALAAPAAIPAAASADVASIDAIIAALYDVISGPAAKPRDWNRLRSLFAPDAKMMVVGPRPDGSFGTRAMSVEDYINRAGPMFAASGFFETELARSTDRYGQIANVFSTYEARHAQADARPFVRGINSIQLISDGTRWSVANMMWRAEDAKLPLPERYLKPGP